MLNDLACKTATAGGLKVRKYFDSQGLYLWALDTGAKRWYLRYQIAGKEKSLSIGPYPAISLKDARKKAAEARLLLADGIDPSARKQATRAANVAVASNTFGAVAASWFAKHASSWTERYAHDTKRRLEVDSKALTKRPIAELKRKDLITVLEKIEARSTATAHRVRSLWAQVYEYAIARELCEYNHAAALSKALTPHKSGNRAHVDQKELPDLLRGVYGYDQFGSRSTMLALKLQFHLFVRPGELVSAEWSEINLETATWEIPAARMKMSLPLLVPLSRQALEMLTELKELAGGSRFVFPGRSASKAMCSDTLLMALRRIGYSGKQTSHGTRHLASTFLNESGFNRDAIERQLAHVSGDVRGTYNKALYMPERRKMMQFYSDFLDATESGATITPIARKSA